MNKDFDPSKIQKVPIGKVKPNDYNPKTKKSEEYQKVLKSVELNGLKQPIFVREIAGDDKFVIVDGEQRWTAANDLGYKEIYIYNLGNISEDEAKALTIWFEVQVPFDELKLAPIVAELNSLEFELPYSEEEILDFVTMADFDFENLGKKESGLVEEIDDGLEEFQVRMTKEQLEFVNNCINAFVEKYGCPRNEALYCLCGGR